MGWKEFEKRSQEQFGSLIFMALIAVTSFLVGSQYQTEFTNVSSVETPEQATPAESSVINELEQAINSNTAPTQTTTSTPSTATVSPSQTVTGLVNINSASSSQLDTLPGIGPAYAQAIIDYRTLNGPFVRLEDIQNVKGIGPKTFEKLKDKISL